MVLLSGTPAEVEIPAPHITITFLTEEDSMRRHRESRVVPPEEGPRDCDEPIVGGAESAVVLLYLIRCTLYLLKFELSFSRMLMRLASCVLRQMRFTFRKHRSSDIIF